MRMHHTPSRWILVALVVAAVLLALGEAHGQAAGAAAAFEGRPAMAGPQAGTGAQAGPPQGGIGLQGSQGAERAVRLRPPSDIAQPTSGPVGAQEDAATARQDVAKPRDTGLAREERSAVKKSKRAAKRTLQRSRTGVGEIDSATRTAR